MATNAEIMKQLTDINISLSTHLARDEENCTKIGKMYKIIVTGNGELPLPEMVRMHGTWIESQKQQEKERNVIARDLLAERGRRKWSVILLGLSQGFTLVGLAVAIVLGLK